MGSRSRFADQLHNYNCRTKTMGRPVEMTIEFTDYQRPRRLGGDRQPGEAVAGQEALAREVAVTVEVRGEGRLGLGG